MHKRPKDPVELAALVGRIATGELPNDKDEILNQPDPKERRARAGKEGRRAAIGCTSRGPGARRIAGMTDRELLQSIADTQREHGAKLDRILNVVQGQASARVATDERVAALERERPPRLLRGGS